VSTFDTDHKVTKIARPARTPSRSTIFPEKRYAAV